MIPSVHLFLCMDKKVSPGAVLHFLDIMRAKNWKEEIILICDHSWKSFINVEQSVLLMEKDQFIIGNSRENSNKKPEIDERNLDEFLDQIDDMEVTKITQIGDLFWGRWILSYLKAFHPSVNPKRVDSGESSIELINKLSEKHQVNWPLDKLKTPEKPHIFIDPYIGRSLSGYFMEAFQPMGEKIKFPPWLKILVQEKDRKFFIRKGFSNDIIDWKEAEINLVNQGILCFSDSSSLALTSRTYNVALFNTQMDQSLFVPGDLHIRSQSKPSFSEVINILNHWRQNCLHNLTLTRLHPGFDIYSIESPGQRMVKQNLYPCLSSLHH